MGQVLLSPHALPPGHPYYPASAQLYMNYTAYYPRYAHLCVWKHLPVSVGWWNFWWIRSVRHHLIWVVSAKMPGETRVVND